MRFTKTLAVVAALILPACGEDEETADTGASVDTGAVTTPTGSPTTPTGTTGTTPTGTTGTTTGTGGTTSGA